MLERGALGFSVLCWGSVCESGVRVLERGAFGSHIFKWLSVSESGARVLLCDDNCAPKFLDGGQCESAARVLRRNASRAFRVSCRCARGKRLEVGLGFSTSSGFCPKRTVRQLSFVDWFVFD